MRETYQPITISPAGPPYDHTPGATTTLSHRRRESTQCDRVQRTTTKTRARPRARTRARQRRSVPVPSTWICAQADPTYRLESPSPNRPSNKSNGTFSHPMLLNRARFAILHSFMPHRPSGAAFKSGSTQG